MAPDRHLMRYALLPLILISSLLVSCSGGGRASSSGGLYGASWIPAPRPAEFDLQHLLLDVTVDHASETVTGSVEHRIHVMEGMRLG